MKETVYGRSLVKKKMEYLRGAGAAERASQNLEKQRLLLSQAQRRKKQEDKIVMAFKVKEGVKRLIWGGAAAIVTFLAICLIYGTV